MLLVLMSLILQNAIWVLTAGFLVIALTILTVHGFIK